jgi:hypothetical protein
MDRVFFFITKSTPLWGPTCLQWIDVGPFVERSRNETHHSDMCAANTLRKKLYNALALPVLLYSSETWTIKGRDTSRITTAEMKYMRRRAGYTWTDYKTNTQITKELKIAPILEKVLEYMRNWIQHINRMPRNILPKVMKHYFPTGRRNYGRPLKRHLET